MCWSDEVAEILPETALVPDPEQNHGVTSALSAAGAGRETDTGKRSKGTGMIQTVEIRTDDLDARLTDWKPTKTTVETIRFHLDGTDYEIDLSDKHATELRSALVPFIQHARRTQKAAGNGTRAKAPRPSHHANGSSVPRPKIEDVRAWAKEQHMPVKDRGRISAEITAAYISAH